MTEIQEPSIENPVASFEVGIMTLQRKWIGICIKFAMHDRTHRVMHWPPGRFHELMASLEDYYAHLGTNAFMFRAKDDPALVASLPARHPYHTLTNEPPRLSEDEIGTAKKATSVEAAVLSPRGSVFEIQATYLDSRQETIELHEYTALSLLGYLQQYLDAANRLTGPVGGHA